MRKEFLFLFYLLAGIIIGSLIGSVCEGISFLSWLNYGSTIGLSEQSPAVLDLIIIKISFGFSMTVTIAQIISVAIAMGIYSKIR